MFNTSLCTSSRSSVCLNSGKCLTTNTNMQGYTCTCNALFTGQKCESTKATAFFRFFWLHFIYFIFKDATNPCLNGGTPALTTSNTAGFTCSCPILYLGSNCQYGSPCAKNLCQNNATCVALEEGNDSYLCDCITGFSGDLCEINSAQSCVDKNQNICSYFMNKQSLCSTASFNNVFIKDLCPKSCNNC